MEHSLILCNLAVSAQCLVSLQPLLVVYEYGDGPGEPLLCASSKVCQFKVVSQSTQAQCLQHIEQRAAYLLDLVAVILCAHRRYDLLFGRSSTQTMRSRLKAMCTRRLKSTC